MNPRYAPPCPHRCCCDDGPHEHPEGPIACSDCESLAETHELALKALRIASGLHPETNKETNQ